MYTNISVTSNASGSWTWTPWRPDQVPSVPSKCPHCGAPTCPHCGKSLPQPAYPTWVWYPQPYNYPPNITWTNNG